MASGSTTTIITTGSSTDSEEDDLGLGISITAVPGRTTPTTAKHFQKEKRGVTLVWQDLSIYVPTKKHGMFTKVRRNRPYKRILNNVTGIVYPGSLVAIMGSSGSGKTTLMDTLAYRAPSTMSMTGQIFINGIQTGPFMSSISGYVYQADLFHSNLTVSEHLHFMANMKMDRRLRKYERDRRIEELMQELSLKKSENSRIVTISGGEKKRLSFACEALTDPPLMFLDEATTGLDSLSAQKLVGMMKHMTLNGKTIICTIHQPSSQVFAMFDQLCLLAEGRMAYMGKALEAQYFLQDLNFVCPEHYNPADFYIRTLSVLPGQEEKSRIRIKSICDHFHVSQMATDLDARVEEEMVNCKELTESQLTSQGLLDKYLLGKHHVRRPRWITRTVRLTGRALLQTYRSQTVHKLRLFIRTLLAIIIGLAFLGVGGSQNVQNIEGLLFLFMNELATSLTAGDMAVFPLEFPIFMREHKSGLYDVNSYYISKVVSMTPGFVVYPFVYTTIIYWITGLRPTFDAYLLTCLLVILAVNSCAAFGCFLSTACNNISAASAVLIPFNYVFLITAGIYINVKSLPVYIGWLKFTSSFFYAMNSLSALQWQGTELTCQPGTSPANGTCLTSGDQVLDSFGYSDDHWPIDTMMLLSLYAVFHLLAYNAVLIRSRNI